MPLSQGTYKCRGCAAVVTTYAGSTVACVACGGTMERLHHPSQVRTVEQPSFTESSIRKAFAVLMSEIEARLAAEVELDRIESLWYNKGKGGPDEEADSGDSI